MSTNQFVFNNVSIKKVSWGKRNGFLRIQLFDNGYTKIYDSQADLNNKKEIKRLFNDLESKGCKLFKETSWF